MFWKIRDYILPGKRKIEDAPTPATETRDVSTILVECLVNNKVVNHSWHTCYDPEKDDYLEAYKDFLDWYTKPARQRNQYYTMSYFEGLRVLKREHIVGVLVTKGQREMPVTSDKKDNNE